MPRLTSARAAVVIAAAGTGLCVPSARSQDLHVDTTFADMPEGLFVPTPLKLGSATVTIGANARLDYDSNIYAQSFNEKDDFRLVVLPYVSLARSGGSVELTATAQAQIRKYFQYSSEDAVAAEVAGGLNWALSAADKVSATISWNRVIEDRGEPEGRNVPSLGPRRLDAFEGDLSYKHQGARFGFMVRGTASRFRYKSQLDRDRNLENYGVLGRGMIRVSPLMNAFIEGFASKRDFRLPPSPGEPNRDSSTYGGRVGASIDPGGTIRGEAAVGIYRFDPKDPLLKARTGLSAQIGLSYSPRQRTAITLDGFIGNVATYRTGAQSREDMRFRLGVQQEIRHNLRGDVGLVYRRSKFFGSGQVQKIYGVTGELEYALNRRLALAANARYSKRTSNSPLDDFERFGAGIELRFHY